jgi:hypothetical protein
VQPEPSAIETMRLGTDFIVREVDDDPASPKGLKAHDREGRETDEGDAIYLIPK